MIQVAENLWHRPAVHTNDDDYDDEAFFGPGGKLTRFKIQSRPQRVQISRNHSMYYFIRVASLVEQGAAQAQGTTERSFCTSGVIRTAALAPKVICARQGFHISLSQTQTVHSAATR